jgi:hypothetical protein
MIAEFQKHWEEEYKIKTSDQLTNTDMDESRTDGDDDDEGGNSEDENGD